MRHPDLPVSPTGHDAPPVDPFCYDRGIERAQHELRQAPRTASLSILYGLLEGSMPNQWSDTTPSLERHYACLRRAVYRSGGYMLGGVACWPYAIIDQVEYAVCELGVIRRVGDAPAELIPWNAKGLRIRTSASEVGR